MKINIINNRQLKCKIPLNGIDMYWQPYYPGCLFLFPLTSPKGDTTYLYGIIL